MKNRKMLIAVLSLTILGLAACSGGGSGSIPVAAAVNPDESPLPSTPQTPGQSDPEPVVNPPPNNSRDLSLVTAADLLDVVGQDVTGEPVYPFTVISRCIMRDRTQCEADDAPLVTLGDMGYTLNLNGLMLETPVVFTGIYQGLEIGRQYLPVLLRSDGGILSVVRVGDVFEGTASDRVTFYHLFDEQEAQSIMQGGTEGFTFVLIAVDPDSVNSDLIKVSKTAIAQVTGAFKSWDMPQSDRVNVQVEGWTDRADTFSFEVCDAYPNQILSIELWKFRTDLGEFDIHSDRQFHAVAQEDGCARFSRDILNKRGPNILVVSDGTEIIRQAF